MQTFDIIVIGAGPAGSAAATWAARHGARVALIDKAQFPRNKLCGGLFTERSRSYYREIFDQEFDLSDVVSRDAIEFWHQGECLAQLNDIPPLHLTMRLDLDNRLYNHALEAGVLDFTGQPVATLTDTRVTFRDGNTLTARILIGADGVNSVTARHLFGTPFDKDKIGFGLEIETPTGDQPPEQNPLRIDFGAAVWGYGWSFPKKGSTTIGVGGLLDPNPDMKRHFSAYLSQLGLDPDQQKFKGHYLPFGDFRERPGRNNVLLVGDAAGLVDPITGEGIAFAMKSGHLAAQAALEALAADAPNSAFGLYKVRLKGLHRSLRIARNIRRIIFAPRWEKAFTSTFRRSGTVRMQYMRLLAGEVEYPELALSVVKRLPRYVLNRFRR